LTKMINQSIIDQLRERGLKITSQRRAIIEALIEERHLHPSAFLIYKKARKRKEGLSLSTVYATLNELSSLGLIKTLQFDEMENRYEGNLEEHVNLICGKCRKILDCQAPITIDKKKVAKKIGFSITDSRIEYYGLCRECRKGAGRKRRPQDCP
jgi:Fur family peroxide stress response transcriptional regulator